MGELLRLPLELQISVENPDREFVKKWSVSDLLPKVEAAKLESRDPSHGRQIMAEAACFKCHRFRGQGGAIGPDLTTLGRRFDHRTQLESLIEPSKVVSDQYQTHQFVLDSGKVVTGRIVNLARDEYWVMENMLNPGDLNKIKRDKIEEMQPAEASMMPAGLLDNFTEDEILDLLAYLRSGTE